MTRAAPIMLENLRTYYSFHDFSKSLPIFPNNTTYILTLFCFNNTHKIPLNTDCTAMESYILYKMYHNYSY